ncbi:MAG: nitrous oxide-stimulated promoter family protein [Syntrophomonadaceae bacterium]
MTYSRKLEAKTLDAMLEIYCHDKHGSQSGELCPDCTGLSKYAHQRIEKCFYGDSKPVCSMCQKHCYKKDRRESIKKVMRYSGPKMLWHSPLLSIRYFYRKLFKSNVT